MKNRLQFNRNYAIYPSREEAKTALNERITGVDFIPLIGEPIVLRYKDENDKLQLMLAIGKKAGSGLTLEDREYHIIDTALIDERLANEISERVATDEEIFGILSGLTDASENLIKIVGSGWTDEPDNVTITDRLKRDEELAGIKWGHDEDEPFDGRLDPAADEISGDSIMQKLVKVNDDLKEVDKKVGEGFLGGGFQVDITDRIKDIETNIIGKQYPGAPFDNTFVLNGDHRELRPIFPYAVGTNVEGQIDSLNRALIGIYGTAAELSELIENVRRIDDSFELSLDSENAIISLNWTDEDGWVRHSSINVSDFTKDSFLENVQVVTRDGVQYIEFRFKTYDGEPVPIYVPLTDLATIYKAGEGIDRDELENNQIITVKIDPMHEGEESYLTKSPNGLRVTGITEAIEGMSGTVIEIVNSAMTVISGAVEDYVEEKLSGITGDIIGELEEKISAVSENLSALSDYVVDNEEVTAAALNDLNGRVSELEIDMTGEHIPLTNYTLPESLPEEDTLVNDNDTVNEGFGKVQRQILDNEAATNEALNDFEERLAEAESSIVSNSAITELQTKIEVLSAITHNTDASIEVLSSVTSAINVNLISLSGAVEGISAKTSGVLTINVNGQEQGKYSPSANTTVDLEIIQEVTGADVLLTGYGLSSAHTEEELTIYETDNVNEAFGKVQRQIIDNETVTAGALNDLNDRINAIGSGGSADVANLSGNVMSNFVHSAEYISENDTHEIRFKNANGAVISTVNANDFIKDGMVDNVVVSGGNLVITFNTDAGKEAISIPLTNIFNPDNYYTKNEVNALSSATVNMSGAVVNNQTNISTVSGDVISLSASVVANKTNITALSAGTIQLSADTKAAIAALSAGTIQLSADTYSAISTLTNEMYDNELVIAAALNDLNSRIIEVSGTTPDLSNYYTKAEVDQKIASGGTFDPSAYYNKTDINNGVSAATRNLSAATVGLASNVAKIAVTGVTVTGNGNAVTNASYANSALTLTKGNVQEVISDLSTIRNNAASGANAYTAVTQLSNNIQNNYYTKTEVDQKIASGGTFDPSAYYNKTDINNGVSASTKNLSGATVDHINNNDIHVTSTEKTTWNGKQDAISDLTTIRNNATSGANAYTGVTQLSGAVQNGYYTKAEVDQKIASGGTFDPSAYYNKNDINTGVSASTKALSGETVEHINNNDIHVTSAEKTAWNGKQDAINDLADIRNKATSGSNAYTAVTQLSGAVQNGYYTKEEVDQKIASGGTFDPSAYYNKTDINNGVSASTKSLSSATVEHINNNDIHVTANEKSTWSGKQDAISDLTTIRNNSASGAVAYTNVKDLSAVTLTGVTLNGNSATINNHVAALTFNETQLSTGASQGEGNVVTSVSVDGHKITLTKGMDVYTKAEVDQKIASGGTFDPEAYYNKTDINNGVSASTRALSAATTAHTANTDIHVTSAEKSTWNGKQDAISDLGNIRNGANSGASAYTAVTQLSSATMAIEDAIGNYFDGAEYVSSAKTIVFKHGDTVKAQINASGFVKDGMVSSVTISDNNLVITFNTDAGKEDITLPLTSIFNSENYYTKEQINTGVSATTKALSGSVVALSAATYSHSGDTTRHITSAERTRWNNGANSGSSAWTELLKVSAIVETLESLGDGLTGVTFNGSAATITDKVAAILFNETQLSTGTTGTGNVVGSISVNNHKITSTMFSAASADQIAKLSAATVNIKNNAITAETPVTAVKNGTNAGNVIGTIAVDGTNKHQINYTVVSAATAEQLVSLSGATMAHISDNTVHVTSNEKNYWTDGANSGASAWTSVLASKKFAEAKSSGNIYLDKYLTIYNVSAGSSAKTLTFTTLSNNVLSNMASGEVIESQVILDNSNGSSNVRVDFTTDITGATLIGTLGRYDRNTAWVDANGYGEANILVVKTGNNSYTIYVITT